MNMYVLIHPFGGDEDKFNAGRKICEQIRAKHPEMLVIYGLDNVHYCDKTTAHSVINTWCGELVNRADGIIVPHGWETSPGCRYEVEQAERLGKVVLFAPELM